MLGFAVELISGQIAMLDNATFANTSNACGTALHFSQPNAEASYFAKNISLGPEFQIDFKFKLVAATKLQTLVIISDSKMPSIVVQVTQQGFVRCTVLLAFGANTTTNLQNVQTNDGLFHHLVVQRKNENIWCSVDGTSSSVMNIGQGVNFANSTSLLFGRDSQYQNYFSGYLDEFRIWRGCLDNNQFLPVISACKNCTCSKYGVCVAGSSCKCANSSFVGASCETSCFGLAASNPSACSAHGACMATGIKYFIVLLILSRYLLLLGTMVWQ